MSDNSSENDNKPPQESESQNGSSSPTSATTTTTGEQPPVISLTPKATPEQTTSSAEQHTAEPPLEPFEAMQKREYNYTLDQEIKKGMQKISERFARLISQENTPTEVAKDSIGNTSDYYERIMNAIHAGNYQWLADTKEGVYQFLYDLDFTEMRKLEAIKQEYNQT